MKSILAILFSMLMIIPLNSCSKKEKYSDMNIIFLHHSTGGVIWGTPSLLSRAVGKVNKNLSYRFFKKTSLPFLLSRYNKNYNKNYLINEKSFPKSAPYGWKNYPYDYYNIWVKNAGNDPFMEEPTLEILTKEYQVVIFKHCFPVCNIQADQDSTNINSEHKTISNYKIQYLALRDKLQEFPATKFILFTGAALVKRNVSEDEAIRAREFFKWVTEEWDLSGDNIYLWDLYNLQTEGGLYFKDNYAFSPDDSHPNGVFASRVVKLLCNRIVDIIENDGKGTKLTGETKISININDDCNREAF